MMTEYFLPLLGHFGFKDYLKATPDLADSDVTAEYCARHNWIVGSPATVTENGCTSCGKVTVPKLLLSKLTLSPKPLEYSE